MHLLDQRRIAGETAGVEIAHLLDQRLQLLPRLGTFLHYCANAVEKVQTLINLALSIGRVRALLGRHGMTGDLRIAGIPGANVSAVAILLLATAGIANRTRGAIAYASLASAALLATLLTTLPGLSTLLSLLATLAVLRLLLALLTALLATALLPLLALLTTLLTGLPSG